MVRGKQKAAILNPHGKTIDDARLLRRVLKHAGISSGMGCRVIRATAVGGSPGSWGGKRFPPPLSLLGAIPDVLVPKVIGEE